MRHPKDWIHPRDLQHVLPVPDPDFDPSRNKRIIENVIQETDKMQRQKQKDFNDRVDERSSAVMDYLKSLDRGGKATQIERYFGKKYIAYLRGQEFLSKLQQEYNAKKKQKGT